jgi:hypothetical protein
MEDLLNFVEQYGFGSVIVVVLLHVLRKSRIQLQLMLRHCRIKIEFPGKK